MRRPRPSPPGHPTARLVGQSAAIHGLCTQIRHLAAFDTLGNPHVPTLLLCGETGTGKGLVARIVHDSGPRARGAFIEVNCAAIPESLLEAELFGFEAGAFTDAKRTKLGLFEAASGGTLFLDEIDALMPSLQSKLLTAIEAKRVRRVGAVVERPVDVKLIAATQADLSQLVRAGRFRPDLYHRLAVIVLELPPLRAREEDILLLAQHFLQQYAAAHTVPPKRLSAAAEAWLLRARWPGNVRELRHLMERGTLLHAAALLDPEALQRLHLPQPDSPSRAALPPASGTAAPVDDVAHIRQALEQTAGNVVQAARLLGLSRSGLRYRMLRYGLGTTGGGKAPSPHAVRDRRATARFTRNNAQTVCEVPTEPAANWEQKLVAVLAIELTWPESMDAESWRYEPWTVSAHWEQALVEKVQGFGGRVVQRSPSLIMVAFGLPQTLEQLPQRAVQAALAIRQLVVEAEAQAGLGACPMVRQAVHWGSLLVEAQAHKPAARLLPVSDTLARPVRLLGHAAAGDILVSPEVGRLIEGWYELQARAGGTGAREADQALAYSIIGLSPRRSPLERYGQRPLSRFVGRERELASLQDLLGRVEAGQGQVVGLMGEPGVGKTRLLYEFVRTYRSHGWLILESHADSYGKVTPYLPVIDLLKAYFQVEGHDDVRTVRDKVTSRLLTLDPALQATLPAVFALLEVPVEDPLWPALDPHQRRQRTLDALKNLWRGESEVQPLLLIVENLHWIDTETQAFLDLLIDSLPAPRLLLLVSCRPEYQHGWGSKTYYTQLRLDPLPRPSVQALLDDLLGDDAGLEVLKRRLSERTEGNPFFLEESVQTLVETQILIGEPGAYHLAAPLPSLQVPTTMQAVLAARIDRLPPEEKGVLQAAAVIGKDVPIPLLQAITEVHEGALRRGLASLQAAEFLYETHRFPTPAYAFKHALTQEVAYNSVLAPRRQALHRQVATAIEALHPERLQEHYERLAEHYERGAMWEKALAYLVAAGQKAQQAYANQEALTHYDRALAVCARLGHTVEPAALLRLYAGKGAVHFLRSEFPSSVDAFQRLRAVARQLGDRAKEAEALYQISFGCWRAHEIEHALDYAKQAKALALEIDAKNILAGSLFVRASVYKRAGRLDQEARDYEEALRISREVGDKGLEGLTLVELGSLHDWKGEYEPALRLLEQSATIGRAHNLQYLLLRCLWRLGLARCGQGEYEAALRALREGLELSERLGDKVHKSRILNTLGWVCGELYALERALRYNRQGVEAAYAIGDPEIIRNAEINLGDCYRLAGDLEQAQFYLEKVDQDTQRRGTPGEEWMKWRYAQHLYHSLGELWLTKGDAAQALRCAEACLELASSTTSRKNLVKGRRLQGQAYCRQRRLPEAEAALQRALTSAREIGNPPQLWQTYQALGQFFEQLGRRDQVKSAYASALRVIDGVAIRLQDQELKRTFLAAMPVKELRERDVGAG
jgi:DNA-binding NtrC family response regulator/tetratricopeptide (TPR) repeat protein